MAKKRTNRNPLTDFMSPQAIELLSASGSKLVEQIGLEVIRGVVLDVLTGKNLRDSTESLTRRRLAALNLEMIELFMRGSMNSDDFIARLPKLAEKTLTSSGQLAKSERWLAQWLLGLTDKAFQNVLRDNPDALADYRERYIDTCQAVIADHERNHGKLTGLIETTSGVRAEINWLWMLYLLNTIGAQTLAIRGSEKSAYGKLFEKLILGSLLYILGFEHILPPPQSFNRVFWLASREERRESDATLLYQPGKGVRFDIGFIGRGNPEISLDKVTRFEREISLGRSIFYMATIILVDRIGANSRIEQLAKEVERTIIQMSAGYWPQQVAQVLNQKLGYKHELAHMEFDQIESYLRSALQNAPLEDFIGLSPAFRRYNIREEAAVYAAAEDQPDD